MGRRNLWFAAFQIQLKLFPLGRCETDNFLFAAADDFRGRHESDFHVFLGTRHQNSGCNSDSSLCLMFSRSLSILLTLRLSEMCNLFIAET